jgi:hypothetical protein
MEAHLAETFNLDICMSCRGVLADHDCNAAMAWDAAAAKR